MNMNLNNNVRQSTFLIAIATMACCAFFLPGCAFTWMVARVEMTTSPTYEDWKLLRSMKRASMFGVAVLLTMFFAVVGFYVYALAIMPD